MNLDNYLNRQKLRDITGWGETAITRMLNDMDASGRYPPDDFMRDGKLILLHPHVLADWLDCRKRKKKGLLIAPYKRGG